MHLDSLRNIILNERESARLSEISYDTFDSTRKYLAELQEKVYESEDPLSEESRTLIEEIHSLRETIRELFQIRSRKILALAGARTETSGDREETKKMIPSEREMYRIILSALEDCRRSTAETSGGPIRTAEDTAEKETESESFPERKDEYIIVRMLADVDAFLGVDGRTYSLKKEDVVSLPRINGEVLCDHNIALNIEPGS